MDGKRERLKLVITMLSISQGEIVAKTGYSQPAISNILKSGEPTNKFIITFCNAYPKANKDYILNGEGEPLLGVDLKIYGFSNNSDTQKVSFMEQQIKDLRQQVTYLQQMLEKALLLHPELSGKLDVSLATLGHNGQIQFNLPHGDYKGGYAQA